MQTIQYPSVIAFVEGHMERIFINNNFKYVQVVPVANGCGWSVDRMCDQIKTKYKARNEKYDIVVIWFDREKRKEESAEIRASVIEALDEIGVDSTSVRVGIPDTCTENWILPDEELMQREFNVEGYTYTKEGISGSTELEKMFDIVKRKKYKKTSDGPRLLKSFRFQRSKSQSAQQFFDDFKENC